MIEVEYLCGEFLGVPGNALNFWSLLKPET